MNAAPRFQMVGDSATLVCEDGVCAVPEPAGDDQAVAVQQSEPQRR